jgi:MFS family permease
VRIPQTLRRTFGSLSVRNYRLYFLGQVISINGTWMQTIAQAWLVLYLTHSALALGVTAALRFLPMLLLGAWGGVIADRVDRRRTLVATQVASGLLSGGMGAIALSGQATTWLVYAFAVALGCVQVIDTPARQAFASELVGPRLVANAVSLNAAVFTSARVFGPAVAGLLIALLGTGWCFVVDAASYGAAIGALALMRPGALFRDPLGVRASGAAQLAEGVRYAWATPSLRLPLLMMAVVGMLAFNFNVLLPLVATDVFHGNAGTYGLLGSLLGLGAFGGALLAANRSRPTLRLLLAASLAFGALLLVAAGMPLLALEMVALVPLGAAMTVYQATTNSLLQITSRPEFRGRVMALYMVMFIGTTPIGGPLIGWVAQTFGARAGLAIGGLAAIGAAVAVLAWLRRPAAPASVPVGDPAVDEPGELRSAG